MNSSGRIGPGASTILMILVVLVMTMLGVRTFEASKTYYAAQEAFSFWLSEMDGTLQGLREEAGADEEAYAQLVRAQFGVGVGESLSYRAPAGETRFFCATVELLPLTQPETCAVNERWLETNDAVMLDEDAGWTLIL